MTEKLDSAFPHHVASMEGWHPGMSLRDWFAGQAFNAMASTPTETTIAAQAAGLSRTEFVSQCAYELADAMIAARNNASNKGE